MSCDEFITNVIAAANVWNETAGAEVFRYVGSTTLLNSCAFSIVAIQTNVLGAVGLTNAGLTPVCPTSDGQKYQQFLLSIAINEGTQRPLAWSDGLAASDELDTMSAVAHEFGHVLEIDHPTATSVVDDAGAIMRPTIGIGGGYSTYIYGNTQARDPYFYDLKCATEFHPARNGVAMTRITGSTGVSSVATAISTIGTSQIVAANVGGGIESTGPVFAAAIQSSDPAYWNADVAISGGSQIIGPLNEPDGKSYGFTSILFREEDPHVNRISFIVDNDYPTQYSLTGKHILFQSSESDGFGSATSLRYCSINTIPCPAGSRTRIFAGRTPGFGFVGGTIGKTVVLWRNQARDESAADRELWVSVGISDGVLSPPDKLGVRSDSGYAIACSNSAECVVAYSSLDTHRIITRKALVAFSSSKGRNEVVLTAASGFPDFGETNSRMAMWFDGVHYWLAAKAMYANEMVYVWRSQDGISWSFMQQDVFWSAVGPSSASVWRGTTNRVFYLGAP
jgi:hypothetical protein